MKKQLLLILTIFGFTATYSQSSLKLHVGKSKSLQLFTSDGSVDIQGYDGDTLLIEALKVKETAPAAANGLFYIPTTDKDTQDSISYRIQDTLNYLTVQVLGTYRHLHIRVPNNLPHADFEIYSQMPGAELFIQGYKGDFGISADIQTVRVSKLPGPFSIHGTAEQTILTDISWQQFTGWFTHHSRDHYPYSVEMKGDVDVSFPPDLKADISAYLPSGSIYSNTRDGNRIYSNLNLDSEKRLNGGGILIILRAIGGDIYLRKQ